MIKMLDILKEVKIVEPKNKQELLGDIIKDNIYILQFDTLQEYEKEYGDFNTVEAKEQAKQYFTLFQPEEVYYITIEEYFGEENINLPKPYKNCWIGQSSDDDGLELVFHNLGDI